MKIFTKITEIADAKSPGTLSMEIAIRGGKNRKMVEMISISENSTHFRNLAAARYLLQGFRPSREPEWTILALFALLETFWHFWSFRTSKKSLRI